MDVKIFDSRLVVGRGGGEEAAGLIRQAITRHAVRPVVIAATGSSQFEFLDALILRPHVDWRQVTFLPLSTSTLVFPRTTRPVSGATCRSESLTGAAPRVFHFIER